MGAEGDDKRAHRFGGDWTTAKLEVLKGYLEAYTHALKNTTFRTGYIDAFAGTGYRDGCRNDTEESKEFHQEILDNAEAVMQRIDLPYRVVNVCTGDLGMGQVQKFDIETWMPSRNSYCETHSASRFYEFQARRLRLRYRDEAKKVRFCHTLNNTVIASPRVLIPILELYQNADGTVTIPEALRPYMGGRGRIERQ